MIQWYWYVWWILSNGVTEYLSFDFLLECTRRRKHSWQFLIWLIFSGLWVFMTIRFHFFGKFLLDSFCLVLFVKGCMGIRWEDLAAPAGIIVTLNTFSEGFSAVLMSWISKNIQLVSGEIWIQILVSVLLNFSLFFCLWLIRKRYLPLLQKPVSSYLYILLLPCALIVLAVRYGLQLDNPFFEEYLSVFGFYGSVRIFLILVVSAGIFFLILEVFCKILSMTEHEKTAALLKSQLEGQRIYMEEARIRNEQYASFQHDIDNHLVVLSGLLGEKQYEAAKLYTRKLCVCCEDLFVSVATGNSVLDLLLKEKISYGRQNGIDLECNVQIPSGFLIDDMDLCMIFFNILDNGICACKKEKEENRILSVSTSNRFSFLVIESVNSYTSGQPIIMGTGLENVRKIAEKYQGTMEIQTDSGRFLIRVLLCSNSTDYPE